jgi:hypothetical protein
VIENPPGIVVGSRVLDIISQEQLAALRVAGFVVVHRVPTKSMIRRIYSAGSRWADIDAEKGYHRAIGESIRLQNAEIVASAAIVTPQKTHSALPRLLAEAVEGPPSGWRPTEDQIKEIIESSLPFDAEFHDRMQDHARHIFPSAWVPELLNVFFEVQKAMPEEFRDLIEEIINSYDIAANDYS